MKKTADFLLDMLYPKKCPLCHQILKEKDRLICPECSGKVRPISGPRCMKCGRPVKMEEEYCEDCRKGAHILRRAEVFSGTERSGDSLWYDLSITDVGNMGIFMQRQ